MQLEPRWFAKVSFKLLSPFSPTGDQPKAIEELVRGIKEGIRCQTLMGVTGSGKTFTIANVIERVGLPTLVISHNKTLAAQLFGEFRSFFPHNAVEYFISYYDYYQPEAYIPKTDTYIAKDASINEEIEKLRLRAMTALMERNDVIIVASVSAIYGLGSPLDFRNLLVEVRVGQEKSRDALAGELVSVQYERNDVEFKPGVFRMRGDVLDVFPVYEEYPLRVEFFGDEIEAIYHIHPITGKRLEAKKAVVIYPAKQFVTPRQRIERALKSIEEELVRRVKELYDAGKIVEAQRLETRTRYDMELLREVGHCPGIENYSRHLSGRSPGERPWCLIDYYPKPFLMVIDESHVTVPQIGAMYRGDRSRKETLVEFGFRLPSCLDNRPLTFQEFESLLDYTIFMSATPGEYEVQKSGEKVVEQIVRPTGLLDPKIEVRTTRGQIEDLMGEINERVKRQERVLVLTLTKRMAQELSSFFQEAGIRARYLHSEIDALERVEILRGLRLAEFDVLVGINLLREGLDLPEVSLVAILEADKQGFLRSETALIQIAGRSARHIQGKVLMYADEITPAMRHAIDETNRRRRIQEEYNRKHNIIPRGISKTKEEILGATIVAGEREEEMPLEDFVKLSPVERLELIDKLKRKMRTLAEELNFEEAAKVRDTIRLIMATFGEECNGKARGNRYHRTGTKGRFRG